MLNKTDTLALTVTIAGLAALAAVVGPTAFRVLERLERLQAVLETIR